MEQKSEVSKLSNPNEIEIAKFRMMDVRFDCLVRMFDSGQIQPKSMMPFVERKPLPPQWFKSEMKFTMEFVEDADPYMIGMAVKEAFNKLKNNIEAYEQGRSVV